MVPIKVFFMFLFCAGTFGLFGCIVFAAFTPMSKDNPNRLSWAFALSTSSSCFIVGFASLLAYFRRKGLDVRNYAQSNAMHYRVDEGTVVASRLGASDMSPPPYCEVVGEAGGMAHPSHYLKATGCEEFYPVPPPAYFPPPPTTGDMQVPPPPYTVSREVAQHPVHTSQQQPGAIQHSVHAISQLHEQHYVNNGHDDQQSPVNLEQNQNENINDNNYVSNASNAETDSITNDNNHQNSATNENSPSLERSDMPLFFVLVEGHAIPVYMEEIQRIGSDNLLANSSNTNPIPAYHIDMQGFRLPVYDQDNVDPALAQAAQTQSLSTI